LIPKSEGENFFGIWLGLFGSFEIDKRPICFPKQVPATRARERINTRVRPADRNGARRNVITRAMTAW
jgi:hypothetical protein